MPRKSSTPLALHEVVRIVGAEHAYLFLGAENSERLELRSARDIQGNALQGVADCSMAAVERVRMSREPLAVSGAADGSAVFDGSSLPPRHVLAAPLLLGHRLFGVLYLDRGLTRGPFTESDVEILIAVADHLALALETAHTERLARSQEAALDANRAKSTFIAHMSHELRTPLTAILGYSELLEEEFQDRGDGVHIPDVQRIQSAAKHLLSLINNMLDLSKIEAGKMELYLEEFDLYEVVEEAVLSVLPLLERGGNTFVRSYDATLGRVRLDKMKVRQVLLNLLSNAAKFTARGQIELEVTREPGDNPEVEEQVVLRVADTGIGMSAEQIKRIFEEYAQGSAATTRRYGGTGLGLAISRSFCQRMRGDIEVASGLGEGSVFTVRLPAQLGPEEAQAAEDLGDLREVADPDPIDPDGLGEGELPRTSDAPVDEDGLLDEAGSSLRSGVFPWPV